MVIKSGAGVARVLTCLALGIILGGLAAAWAQAAQAESTSPEAQKCAALAGDFTSIKDAPTVIISAKLVDVAQASLPQPRFTMMNYPLGESRISHYCEVQGYVAPQNKFVLTLPIPVEWNQKLFFTACGGFCGGVDGPTCSTGLARGYASVTGNGGHDGMLGFDGLWARNAPDLQEDFGWRSNHLVTLASKAIMARYYGQGPKHSYMAGCSKGGQAVLLEAQRFPEDFDGLIPAAPVYDYTGRSVVAGAWFAQAVDDGHGGSVLDQAAAEAIHHSVLALCGAQSGVEEGLVTDPLACGWKPEMLACSAGQSAEGCLSPRQVASVRQLMTPPHNSRGEILYPFAYLPGSETEWARWNYMTIHRPDGSTPEAGNYQVATQYLRYLADAKERVGVDALGFDFDHGPASLARARKIYDAVSYDLGAFKARGGKILMWHGMADGGIPFTSSIAYLQGVEKRMGGHMATSEFFRLFLIPGVHHCTGGPGPYELDTLTALENWVEKGEAPDQLIARHVKEGAVDRTRPVFPYPLAARYAGQGDPKQAASFNAIDPNAH